MTCSNEKNDANDHETEAGFFININPASRTLWLNRVVFFCPITVFAVQIPIFVIARIGQFNPAKHELEEKYEYLHATLQVNLFDITLLQNMIIKYKNQYESRV